jgi:hypothetical protein
MGERRAQISNSVRQILCRNAAADMLTRSSGREITMSVCAMQAFRVACGMALGMGPGRGSPNPGQVGFDLAMANLTGNPEWYFEAARDLSGERGGCF